MSQGQWVHRALRLNPRATSLRQMARSEQQGRIRNTTISLTPCQDVLLRIVYPLTLLQMKTYINVVTDEGLH